MLGSVRHRPSPLAFPNSFSETVRKNGMGAASGFRKPPRWVEGAPLGHFMLPKKRGREASGYFPNCFERNRSAKLNFRFTEFLEVQEHWDWRRALVGSSACPQCSTILPFEMRNMSIALTSTHLPVGASP